MGSRLDIYNDMAKADEIKILDKLTKCFVENPDNYLASLFTAEFLGWVQNRIRDDFPVNVMEYINDYSKDEEIKNLQDAVDKADGAGNDLRKGLKEATDRIDFLNEELEMRTRELEEANKDCLGIGTEALSLEDENTHLKAHLYDLEHPTK